MAGKLNVYDLGQGGVNTSKSPVHLDTTELTKGQNAILDTAGVEGGLLKRGGMPRLNSVAMNGSINGAIHVPVAEESAKTETLYVGLEVTSGSNTWRTSTDGSAWSFATSPSKCAQDNKRSNAGLNAEPPLRLCAQLDGRLYYATDGYTAHSNSGHGPPPLRVFDGTNDEPVASVPYNPSVGDTTNVKMITDIIAANKRIYFASFDGSGGPTRVFEVAPGSGQITQIGASSLAGEVGAISADHLEQISDAGIASMKKAGCVAVLLPGCSFFLGVDQAPARRLIQADLPVALATDYNPGSAMIESLPLVMHIACTQMKMTPTEAIVAATANAAAAINRHDRLGAIAVGMQANLVILDVPNHNRWLYEPGRNCVRTVIKRGSVVATNT